jgi:elongation factor Ts
MGVTLEQIKELRQRTGVGIHKVKEALEYANGDVEKAILYMREKGIAKAASRVGKATDKGVVGQYIHGDGNIGVLIEINSETDFAAKTDKFKEIVHDIALHIVASDPLYISIEDIPNEVLEKEKQVYKKDLEGKPENIQEKILENKLVKFYEEVVLLEQKFVKDETKKVKDLINDAIAAIGERIVVSKFARFELGHSATSCGI